MMQLNQVFEDQAHTASIAIHSSGIDVQGKIGFGGLIGEVLGVEELKGSVIQVVPSVAEVVLDPVVETTVNQANTAVNVVDDAAGHLGLVSGSEISDAATDAVDSAGQSARASGQAAVRLTEAVASGDSGEALVAAEEAALAAVEAADSAQDAAADAVQGAANAAEREAAARAQRAADAASAAADEVVDAVEQVAQQALDRALDMTETVREELLNHVILPLVTGALDFLGLLDEALAEIFQTIGETIYNFFNLEDLDTFLTNLLAGGIANFYDVIMEEFAPTINEIKGAFQQVASYVPMVKSGLDTIGASGSINAVILGSRSEEYIKVSDGNGNYGYLTSDQHYLLVGGGGLQDLMNVLKGANLREIVERVQNTIRDLIDIITGSNPSTVLDNVVNAIKDLVNGASDAFRNFLQQADSLGSIQFLVTGELELGIGMVFEIGVSVDVRQLLYFIMHEGNWDPLTTQVASLHVGYAIDGECILYVVSFIINTLMPPHMTHFYFFLILSWCPGGWRYRLLYRVSY